MKKIGLFVAATLLIALGLAVGEINAAPGLSLADFVSSFIVLLGACCFGQMMVIRDREERG